MDHLEYKESLPQNEHVSLMYMYLGEHFHFLYLQL